VPIVWPGGCIYKADLQEGFGRGAKENAVRPKDLFSGTGIRCCVGTGNQVAQGYTWSTLAGIQVSSGAEYHVAGYYIMPIGPRTGSLPCRGRGHRTACTPRRAHALAAVLAFIPLTFSAFWGPMACTLIGGTAAGTILTLVFLPALYAIWFKIRPTEDSTIRVREVIPRMQRRVGGEVA
jgi:hypothetical protein